MNDPNVPLPELLKLVTGIRERIEIVHSSEYRNFLQYYMPSFENILTSRVPCQFVNNDSNKIRSVVLEILNRLPSSHSPGEVLKPYIDSLIVLVMKIMEEDNEENALLCVRILFDLHKSFRPALKQYVPRFLEFVQQLYKELDNTKRLIFPEPRSASAAARVAAAAAAAAVAAKPQTPAPVTSTAQSTAVIDVSGLAPGAEDPTATTGTMGATPTGITSSATSSAPSLATDPTNPTAPTAPAADSADSAAAASTTAASTTAASTTAASTTAAPSATLSPVPAPGITAPKTTLMRSTCSFKVLTECPLIVMLLFQLYGEFVGKYVQEFIPLMTKGLRLSAPSLEARSLTKTSQVRFGEMVACQVKTLSFLTYLIKSFKEQMRPHQETIATSVVMLLKRCPNGSVSTRKELLVATRHILATDFRLGFFQHVDTLLQEEVLIGRGRQAQAVLRPLAYSTVVRRTQNKQPNNSSGTAGYW